MKNIILSIIILFNSSIAFTCWHDDYIGTTTGRIVKKGTDIGIPNLLILKNKSYNIDEICDTIDYINYKFYSDENGNIFVYYGMGGPYEFIIYDIDGSENHGEFKPRIVTSEDDNNPRLRKNYSWEVHIELEEGPSGVPECLLNTNTSTTQLSTTTTTTL